MSQIKVVECLRVFIASKRTPLVIQQLVLQNLNDIFNSAAVDSHFGNASSLKDDVNEGLADEAIASI